MQIPGNEWNLRTSINDTAAAGKLNRYLSGMGKSIDDLGRMETSGKDCFNSMIRSNVEINRLTALRWNFVIDAIKLLGLVWVVADDYDTFCLYADGFLLSKIPQKRKAMRTFIRKMTAMSSDIALVLGEFGL